MSTAGFLFMFSCSRISQHILGGFNQQNGLLFISIEMSYAWMFGALFDINHISVKFDMHLFKSLSQKGSLAIKAWNVTPSRIGDPRRFSMLHLGFNNKKTSKLDLRKKRALPRYHHFNPPQSSTSPPKSHLVMSEIINLPGWLRGKMGRNLGLYGFLSNNFHKKMA